ncbi:MAG: hypothetical protein HLUCCX21_00490 [Porphyrobacter sp. HL-46]|nr:MAG: hypothetical protein HLUCCX21_00490 [Porphyrobacter sp. HL-46]
MRILIAAAFAVVAACGPAEAPAPAPSEAPPAEWTVTPDLSPPGEAEFRAAWADQCGVPESEVGSALCKASALGSEEFSCDFALGDDDYRRFSADLTRGTDSWVLADPETACTVADPD